MLTPLAIAGLHRDCRDAEPGLRLCHVAVPVIWTTLIMATLGCMIEAVMIGVGITGLAGTYAAPLRQMVPPRCNQPDQNRSTATAQPQWSAI